MNVSGDCSVVGSKKSKQSDLVTNMTSAQFLKFQKSCVPLLPLSALLLCYNNWSYP